jgi:hypothetical protein
MRSIGGGHRAVGEKAGGRREYKRRKTRGKDPAVEGSPETGKMTTKARQW